MPSNNDVPGYPGPGELPAELDPRGRRHARRQGSRPAATARGADQSTGSRQSRSERRATKRSGSDVLAGASLGIQVVAAVLSLAVLLGSGWAWAQYRSFKANIPRVTAIPAGGTAASKNNIDGSDQNILIVGNDDRETATDAELRALGIGRDGGSLNTDTMMLMHVPADGSKATVISFPRDSYVDIPGHGKAKLNSAYTDGIADANGDKSGGAQLLVKTVENLTGLSVDHFVQVDLIGFVRISDAIGGVDICLNNNVDDGYSQLKLSKGHHVIQGKTALAFVRQRHGLPGGDLDRIKRQQYFLSAVFRKMSSARTLLNPFKLQNLLKAITKSLQLDGDSAGHTGLDPLKLAQQMQNLQAGNIKFTTIPINGTQDVQIDGGTQNVVVVDNQAMPDFVDSLIGVDATSALANATAAAPSSVNVTVVNDTNSSGLENTNAAALRAAGFKTTVPAPTSDVLAKTTIRYAKGQENAAKALQAQVPKAVMVRSSTVTGVTLLLGDNGVQVKSLMPTAPKSTAPQPTTPSTSSSVPVTTAADAGCIN
ncbi:MAG: LytR family transcriptional regulator [Frankiales bacterium]|nr:LytR family transcriptional regulator [Frankiales bacterium]